MNSRTYQLMNRSRGSNNTMSMDGLIVKNEFQNRVIPHRSVTPVKTVTSTLDPN